MNRINVLPFGQVAEITGQEPFQLEAKDTDDIKRILSERFPELQQKHYAIAVDKVIIKANTQVYPDSIVALLPPFSGG